MSLIERKVLDDRSMVPSAAISKMLDVNAQYTALEQLMQNLRTNEPELDSILRELGRNHAVRHAELLNNPNEQSCDISEWISNLCYKFTCLGLYLGEQAFSITPRKLEELINGK